jgi:hypothetical protein
MMGHLLRWVVVSVLVAAFCTDIASGQETVQLSRVQTARDLAGVVVDTNGDGVAGAMIELCAEGWTDCHAGTVSGSDGRFRVVPQRQRKTYFLRFTKDTFNPLEFKARVSRFSRKYLRAQLFVAT